MDYYKTQPSKPSYVLIKAMCKGTQKRSPAGFVAPEMPEDYVRAATAAAKDVSCELCNSSATLYCEADDAFLCEGCDRWVHGANFLAGRHVRCLICSSCHKFTRECLVGDWVRVVMAAPVEDVHRSFCDSKHDDDGVDGDGDAEQGQERCDRSLKMPFLFL